MQSGIKHTTSVDYSYNYAWFQYNDKQSDMVTHLLNGLNYYCRPLLSSLPIPVFIANAGAHVAVV